MKRVIIATLIFVAVYNLLFFQTGTGFGTGFLFLSLNLYFFFVKEKEGKNLGFGILSSIISVIFAFLYAYRDSDIIQNINLLTATFFALSALYFYKQKELFAFYIPSFILLPLITIKNSITGIFSLFKSGNKLQESVKNDVTTYVIRGLVIAVPIFLVLFFLLTQADPIFNKLTQNAVASVGERIVASLVVFIVLMGFGLSKIIGNIWTPKQIENIPAGKPHELIVILVSIISLFAVFIAVQFRYLFSTIGERELHELGINSLTYSEYVRKGFFELIIVSVVASVVIVYTLKFLHILKGKEKLILQIFASIFTFEIGMLLLSAVKRLDLYSDAHGLTRARVFGFIFLVWLAILLVIFLFRVIKNMKKEWFFGSSIAVTILTLVFINVVNIDGLIATKYKPTVNGEIDYFYLTSLSVDASDAWGPAIKDAAKTITHLESLNELSPEDNRKLRWTRLTLDQLNAKSKYLMGKYATKKQWQSYNLSEYQVFRNRNQHSGAIPYFDNLPGLIQRVQKLENKVSEDVRLKTPIDRSIKPPLIR